MTPGSYSLWHELSREVALSVDGAGTIVWADERARSWLGLTLGRPLRALAVRGAEDKVDRLLALGQRERVSGWELLLSSAEERPLTFAFSAAPHAAGVALVGSLVPEDYGAALTQVSSAMSELSALHRETERQQRELKQRTEELERTSRELQESRRGMHNLHAELNERSESLLRAQEVRSRVVANITHEFRTPLHSILGLSRLLLNPRSGSLDAEQTRQVQFIRSSAEALFELVNDLLDLSKMEAGKLVLRPTRFDARDFLGALRGMMQPLLPPDSPVELRVEQPTEPLELETDETRVSQVLRNLVSNALKFTERGHVSITAQPHTDGTVDFRVHDTGIGIPPQDLERIFHEFTQLDSPLQQRAKGTGLGLALSRRLAGFLGGSLSVRSHPSKGSTFTLSIPRVHPEVQEMAGMVARSQQLDPARAPVLVLEDDRQTLFLYERYLSRSGFQVVPVRTLQEARCALQQVRPAAVVMDVMLEGESSWAFLAEFKGNPATRDIPALVVTVMDREQKARALGADEFWLKPVDEKLLLRKLAALAQAGPLKRVLLIDDDDSHRYVLRQLMRDTPYALTEAASGSEGVRLARSLQPDLVFLEFALPDMTAYDVLDELKVDPNTRDIPVILHTARHLEEEEWHRLAAGTATILTKHSLSRELAISRIRDALFKAGLGSTARTREQHHD